MKFEKLNLQNEFYRSNKLCCIRFYMRESKKYKFCEKISKFSQLFLQTKVNTYQSDTQVIRLNPQRVTSAHCECFYTRLRKNFNELQQKFEHQGGPGENFYLKYVEIILRHPNFAFFDQKFYFTPSCHKFHCAENFALFDQKIHFTPTHQKFHCAENFAPV